MDARKDTLEENDQPIKRLITRKNSAEEKVRLIESKQKEALLDDEKKPEIGIPRKPSKDKIMSPKFFVRSATNEKKEKETHDEVQTYNKTY